MEKSKDLTNLISIFKSFYLFPITIFMTWLWATVWFIWNGIFGICFKIWEKFFLNLMLLEILNGTQHNHFVYLWLGFFIVRNSQAGCNLKAHQVWIRNWTLKRKLWMWLKIWKRDWIILSKIRVWVCHNWSNTLMEKYRLKEEWRIGNWTLKLNWPT